MSSSESDVELKKHSVPKKVTKKTPTSPTEGTLRNQEIKKVTTKRMIHEAISDLTANSRKGVSLHAIKKYMVDKYSVDIDRIGFLIKKNIKMGIEDGSIMQTKGIGVSGSFRMSAKKKEIIKKGKTMKKPKEKTENSDEIKVKKTKNVKIVTEEANVKKKKPTEEGKGKTKTGDKKEKIEKREKNTKKGGDKAAKTTKLKDAKIKETKKKSTKAKAMETPAKKKATMMKRKSIGSIIKPPKMKPKARE